MYLKELCGFVYIILPSEYNLKKRWHKLYHAKRDWNKFESLQCSTHTLHCQMTVLMWKIPLVI